MCCVGGLAECWRVTPGSMTNMHNCCGEVTAPQSETGGVPNADVFLLCSLDTNVMLPFTLSSMDADSPEGLDGIESLCVGSTSARRNKKPGKGSRTKVPRKASRRKQ
eukprot:735789-Rhodomonas_salina.1